LSLLPLFHIGGHILWTLPHLMIGAKVLLLRRFDPEQTLQLIEREKVTNTYFIQAMAKMVIALPNWKKYDLRSIRFVGSGGEAVSDSITGAFGSIGIPILNSYGLTETSDGTMSIRPYDAAGKSAHCIGKPLPFVDAKIVDFEGKELGPGEQGEIVHRGPTVVESYWRRPEETAKAFRNGWFHTGDIATRDESGYFYFLGRKDDMMLTGGENVYTAEVEEAILSHPKVADAAVLGVPDAKWGQAIKAIIAPLAGETLDAADLERHLADRLSSFKRPRKYEFVDQLPKIGSGKLDRALIKKTYGQA
jgi:fatty-acyl-CoA synthase